MIGQRPPELTRIGAEMEEIYMWIYAGNVWVRFSMSSDFETFLIRPIADGRRSCLETITTKLDEMAGLHLCISRHCPCQVRCRYLAQCRPCRVTMLCKELVRNGPTEERRNGCAGAGMAIPLSPRKTLAAGKHQRRRPV